LFICCLVCHGELAQLKPGPDQLTQFYLIIASGGALGGLFVALAAPLIFTSYLEVAYGLFLCALLVTVTRSRKLDQIDIQDWRRLACPVTACARVGPAFALVQLKAHAGPTVAPLLTNGRIGIWILVLALIGYWIARK